MIDRFSQGMDRLGSTARIGLTALSHRGELAALETGEARDHLAGSVALGLGATVFAVLGGFAFNFAIAASLWHRADRALLLAFVALAQLALAAGLVIWTCRRLRHWEPLRETRRQLRRDSELLQTLLPGGDNPPERQNSPAESDASFQPTARGPLS
jgi:uncharacterized membrane protein YqjE